MFFSLIQNRRSIRKFKKQPVEEAKIEMLLEAALRAPSSRSINPWEFIVVSDSNLLKKLSESKPHGSAFLKNAPLGIVVLADSEKSDVWIEDTSIACIFIQLAAESLSLGSCWIQIRKRMHDKSKTAEAYVSDLLNIPKNFCIESIIAIGYPDEKKYPMKKTNFNMKKSSITNTTDLKISIRGNHEKHGLFYRLERRSKRESDLQTWKTSGNSRLGTDCCKTGTRCRQAAFRGTGELRVYPAGFFSKDCRYNPKGRGKSFSNRCQHRICGNTQ
jgi:nitroreductase